MLNKLGPCFFNILHVVTEILCTHHNLLAKVELRYGYKNEGPGVRKGKEERDKGKTLNRNYKFQGNKNNIIKKVMPDIFA